MSIYHNSKPFSDKQTKNRNRQIINQTINVKYKQTKKQTMKQANNNNTEKETNKQTDNQMDNIDNKVHIYNKQQTTTQINNH